MALNVFFCRFVNVWSCQLINFHRPRTSRRPQGLVLIYPNNFQIRAALRHYFILWWRRLSGNGGDSTCGSGDSAVVLGKCRKTVARGKIGGKNLFDGGFTLKSPITPTTRRKVDIWRRATTRPGYMSLIHLSGC